jgi:hypothetical protein
LGNPTRIAAVLNVAVSFDVSTAYVDASEIRPRLEELNFLRAGHRTITAADRLLPSNDCSTYSKHDLDPQTCKVLLSVQVSLGHKEGQEVVKTQVYTYQPKRQNANEQCYLTFQRAKLQ